MGQNGEQGYENLKKAQTFFQSIGASTIECDTIEVDNVWLLVLD